LLSAQIRATDSASGRTTMAVLVGTFNTQTEADQALADLEEAGFSDGDLSIISRTDAVDPPDTPEQRGHWAVDAATVGAAVGVVVGGALLGPVGALIGGAAAGGGLAAAFKSRGMAEREAQEYEAQLRAGRVVLAVDAGDRVSMVEAILDRAGARRITVDR
jgi:hypothetical protein